MKTLVIFIMLIITLPSFAVFEDFKFSSVENETRYLQITSKLRCLVCQNQSLADSAAGLATDLRIVVFEMIEENKSDDEITGFLLERYGDYVLYDPPLSSKTLLLWIVPFLVIAVQVFVLLKYASRKKAQ